MEGNKAMSAWCAVQKERIVVVDIPLELVGLTARDPNVVGWLNEMLEHGARFCGWGTNGTAIVCGYFHTVRSERVDVL